MTARTTERQREWLRNYWSLRFVRQLIATGKASLDEATDDLVTPWPDGGQWRGSIPKELKRNRLIIAVDSGQSRRRSRKGCLQNTWATLDLPGLHDWARHLDQWLRRNPVMPGGNGDPPQGPRQKLLF